MIAVQQMPIGQPLFQTRCAEALNHTCLKGCPLKLFKPLKPGAENIIHNFITIRGTVYLMLLIKQVEKRILYFSILICMIIDTSQPKRYRLTSKIVSTRKCWVLFHSIHLASHYGNAPSVTSSEALITLCQAGLAGDESVSAEGPDPSPSSIYKAGPH